MSSDKCVLIKMYSSTIKILGLESTWCFFYFLFDIKQTFHVLELLN